MTADDSARRWMHLAATAAAAVGRPFLIGVRAHNGTWFATCDGIEIDGSGPATATRAVVEALRQRAEKSVHAADQEIAKARATATALGVVIR